MQTPRVTNTSELYSISVVSGRDIRAGGWRKDVRAGIINATLVEHWDGRNWQVVPLRRNGLTAFGDLVAISRGTVWAAVNEFDAGSFGDRPGFQRYSCSG